ncbi:MAG TPA: EamA family transporter, partial [Desulfuromonadales bacterium]|nr:EamA family transporter [Desulfuromonadales bacterium]
MNSGKSNPIEVVNEETRKSSRHGVLYGLAAYTAWGSFPLFFKALHGAMPLEIVAHRIFWAAVYLMILSLLTRQIGVIRKTVKDRICLLTLCGSTLLIATNWLTFLYAIQADQVLQSSLGYFMTPLVSVLLG